MEKLEKFKNIIKNKFDSELMYSTKYLKAEQISTKESFQCLYASVISIDVIFRKD